MRWTHGRTARNPVVAVRKKAISSVTFEDAVMDSLYVSVTPALLAAAIIGYSLFQAYG